MPQQPEAKFLCRLTEVPAGWPLAIVIDTFADLAYFNADRAREALSGRLVELWAAQPAEAEAWLERCRERFAQELAGKETRQELLSEALLRHEAAEFGKYNATWRFSEAGLLRGSRSSAAERERRAAECLQCPLLRARCRELAERLEEAESQETARKRQKLEEETAERRRLEAELHKTQEEGRDLRNRLAAAEAQVSSKTAELQTAQSESAMCKQRCEELASRTAAAESALTEMRQELRQLQGECSNCRERCEELLTRLEAAEAEASEHAKTKELLAQAESHAAEKQLEVQRLQEESRECVSAEEAKSNVELRLQNAVLLERCEQLRQQLAKAEGKLGQMQVLWEEKATYKERCRQLERQLSEAKPPHSGGPSVHATLSRQGQAPSDDVASRGNSDLTEYILVDDEVASSLLSHSSWFSVKPDCFMADAIFKTRSSGVDFFMMGRDLRKGSQVVAGDDETILEVCEAPVVCQAKDVVRLQAGAATLRVTADHAVQVPAADGGMKGGADGDSCRYVPAGSLKPGALVMLDSGEPMSLTGVASESGEHEVLKLAFKPNLSVAVFSCSPCILSKGANSKPAIRRAKMGRRRGQGSRAEDADEGRASMPNTAGTSTEILLRGAA